MNTKSLTSRQKTLLELFESAKRPLSVEEAWEGVGRQTMSLATLYRALGRLVELGRLKSIEISNAPQMYEAASIGHHHHFFCTTCGKVFEVDACPNNLSSLVPPGFTLKEHTITLYGDCKECTVSETSESDSRHQHNHSCVNHQH
jgi:Fur family ferric uptake transcriptional regulator